MLKKQNLVFCKIIVNTFIFFSLIISIAFLYQHIIYTWWTRDDTQILRHALCYSPWQYFSNPDIWCQLTNWFLTPWLTFTYDLDYYLFGLTPKWFYIHHLFSLSVCSFLLYLSLRLWIPLFPAIIGTTVFIIGPPIAAMVPHLWIRHYIEGFLFALLSNVFFITSLRKDSYFFSVLTSIFYLLAISCKEVFVPLGVIFISIPEKNWHKRLLGALPSLFILFFYALWRWQMLGKAMLSGYGIPVHFQYILNMPKEITQTLFYPGCLFDYLVGGLMIIIGITPIFIERKRQNLIFALVVIVMVIIPIVPVAWGVSGNPRYVFCIWAVLCIVMSLGFSKLWEHKWLQICLLISVCIICGRLIVTREITYYPLIRKNAGEIKAKGQFIFYEKGTDKVLINPGIGDAYYENLMWIRENYQKRPKGPIVSYDPFFLLEKRFNKPYQSISFWEWDKGKNKVVQISDYRMRALWQSLKTHLVPNAHLSLYVECKDGVIKWRFGPYKNGKYIPLFGDYFEGGGHPLSPRGQIRLWDCREKTLKLTLKYLSPQGWFTYSPTFSFTPSLHQNTCLKWQR